MWPGSPRANFPCTWVSSLAAHSPIACPSCCPPPPPLLAASLSVADMSLDALNTAQEEDLLVLRLFRCAQRTCPCCALHARHHLLTPTGWPWALQTVA